MLHIAAALVGAPVAAGSRVARTLAGGVVRAAAPAVNGVAAPVLRAAAPVVQAAGPVVQAVLDPQPGAPRALRRRRVRQAGELVVAEVRGLHRGIPRSRQGEIEALAARHELEMVQVNAAAGRVCLRPPSGSGGDSSERVRLLLDALDELTGDASLPADIGMPGDREPVVAAAVATAGTVLSIGLSRLAATRLVSPVPSVVAAAVALVDNQPRLRRVVEAALGPVHAELALAVASAAGQAVTGSTLGLATDAVQRGLGLVELLAREQAWARWEPVLHSLGLDDVLERAEPPERTGTTPRGPVEQHGDRAALAGAVAPVLALAGRRGLSSAADTVLLAVPKASRAAREAFGSVLGTALSRRGVVALDTGAWRRLDRLDVVVVDADALRAGSPLVLDVRGGVDGWNDARLWSAAQESLWGGATEASVTPTGPAPDWVHVTAGGQVVGEALVGRELDPRSEELVVTCRRAGLRVLLAGDRPPGDFRRRVDGVLPASESLSAAVRRLQRDGSGVAVVSRGAHRALASADVAIGVVRCEQDAADVSWEADLLVDGLEGAIRVLAAVPAARSASHRGAALAASGSLIGLLLLVSGSRRQGLLRAVSPVAGAGIAGLVTGSVLAARAARERVGEGHPMVPWHALPLELVEQRLANRVHAPSLEDHCRLFDEDGRRGVVARFGEQLSTARRPPAWLARGVQGRLTRGGLSMGRHVAAELADPLTPVLSVGAAASAVLGSPTDAALVGAVMGANAVVSAWQRLRAEHAMRGLLLGQALQGRRLDAEPGDAACGEADLSAARTIPAEQLRPGELVVLGAGDVVPADARLVAAHGLELDESALTGESLTVDKDTRAAPRAPLAERTCMVYAGTTVVAGTGCALVVAPGTTSEAGRAIEAVRHPGSDTGVQAQLRVLTEKALPLTIAGGAAVTVLGRLRLQPLRTALADGIAVAVAAVPEGLPLVATVAQLAAARRLSRRGVLVRSSRTVEALGRLDNICFDKTGTLTEGRLEAVALGDLEHDWTLAEAESSPDARRLLRAAARACPPPDEGPAVHATDQAVLEAAQRHLGLQGTHVWEPLEELPFQSNRGYAASVGRTRAVTRLIVKGAPEVLLPRCRSVLRSPDGRVVEREPLDEAARRRAEQRVHELAGRGLRVLAVARRELTGRPEDLEAAVDRLTLVGFVGLADVARPTARVAVERLHEAGIGVRMITGDHPVTARAVAEQLGFTRLDVLVGQELEDLDEEEVQAAVASHHVFARVTPEQKVRIVEALQARGSVVGMAGDGSNDAAAIRRAEVGIAVLGRGSTPASQAADLVVTGGDLVVLLSAVLEGRRMWQRTRDAVSVLVGGNAGEVAFTIIGAAVTGRTPVNTRQLLLVNLLTDMFPAMAVALAPDREVTAVDPRPDQDTDQAALLARELAEHPPPEFNADLLRGIAFRGVVTAAAATTAWGVGRVSGRPRRASSMGLVALVGAQLLQTLHVGRRSPLVWATVGLSGLALVTVVQVPVLSQFFGCTPLGPVGWGSAAAAAVGCTLAGGALAALANRRQLTLPAAVTRLLPVPGASDPAPAAAG